MSTDTENKTGMYKLGFIIGPFIEVAIKSAIATYVAVAVARGMGVAI